MRRVLATFVFLAVLFAPAAASAQSPFLAPYTDPDQESLLPPDTLDSSLDVTVNLDSTGDDSVDIRGYLDSSADYFSLSRNVADSLGLARNDYDIDLNDGSEAEDIESFFEEVPNVDGPQATLDPKDRLATKNGDDWTYQLNTRALQRVAVQNGFTSVVVNVCPATDDFDFSNSSVAPDLNASSDDDCIAWQAADNANPIDILVVDSPQTQPFWNLTIGQAIAGLIILALGLGSVALARRKGHLKTLNGATIIWIVALSFLALFVWLAATISMLVSNRDVDQFVLANDLDNSSTVLAYILPALLPTLGVVLVIIWMTFARPPLRSEAAVEPPRGTGGPTPPWMNQPEPPRPSAPPAPAPPAPPTPAPPAPAPPAPAPEPPTPSQEQPTPPTSPEPDEPKREDPPSWNPPS